MQSNKKTLTIIDTFGFLFRSYYALPPLRSKTGFPTGMLTGFMNFISSIGKDFDTDYLVFTLDLKKHSKFVQRILGKKKPKLILQDITTPLKEWGNKQPFLYVGFDHVIGSRMIADYYMKNIKAKSKYALLYGTKHIHIFEQPIYITLLFAEY